MIKLNPGRDLEERFRAYCRTQRRSMNEQFRIELERILSGTESETKDNATVPDRSDIAREDKAYRDAAKTIPDVSEEIPNATETVPNGSAAKVPLTAAQVLALSDDEKLRIIVNDTPLTPEAVEALNAYSSANPLFGEDDDPTDWSTD